MFYLVLDGPTDRPIHVFLARPSHPRARPVCLTLLAIDERAGRAPAPRPVRPAIGRSPTDPDRFIEFVSEDAARRDGFEPVGQYRVCEVWDDYLDPWPVPHPAPTSTATLSPEGTDPHSARSESAPDSGQNSDILIARQ